MYSVTKTQIRPNTETKFYFERFRPADDVKKYIKEKFMDTGKLIKTDINLTGDRAEFKTLWESRAALLEFQTDEFISDNVISPAFNYELDNDIKTSFVVEEI